MHSLLLLLCTKSALSLRESSASPRPHTAAPCPSPILEGRPKLWNFPSLADHVSSTSGATWSPTNRRYQYAAPSTGRHPAPTLPGCPVTATMTNLPSVSFKVFSKLQSSNTASPASSCGHWSHPAVRPPPALYWKLSNFFLSPPTQARTQ